MHTAVGARRARLELIDAPLRRAPLATGPVLALTAAVGAVLLALSWRAGWSAGELVTLARARHLSWGYAADPPLLPALVRLLTMLGGDAPVVARLPATLLTAAGVVVTALTARELGASRRAQVWAAAVYAGSAAVLGVGYVLSSAAAGAFLWAVCGWLLARWAGGGGTAAPVWLGVVTAVGAQVDYLIVLLWLVAAVALLTVGPRRLVTGPRLWLALGAALASTAPELIWQARHGWPASLGQLALDGDTLGPKAGFLPLLPLATGLVAGATAAGYGAARLLLGAALCRYAFLGWTAIGAAAALLLLGARPALLVGLFPALWAAAAVELERQLAPRPWRWLLGWPAVAVSALLALPGAPGLPGWAGWPNRQTEPLTWLTRADASPAGTGHGARAGLDPQLGPRQGAAGWSRSVGAVANAYQALPAETRRSTVLVTDSDRVAAVLERYGPPLGLPPVYCPRGDYGFFATPPPDAERMLYVGDPTLVAGSFGQLTRLGTAPGLRPAGAPLWLAAQPRDPWDRLWPAWRAASGRILSAAPPPPVGG